MKMPAEAMRVPAVPAASPSPSPLLQHCRHQHLDDRSVVKVLNMESDSGLMVDAFSQVREGKKVLGEWKVRRGDYVLR